MTPKQKSQRKHMLEMIKILEIKGNFQRYSNIHLRYIIENHKAETLAQYGFEYTQGF